MDWGKANRIKRIIKPNTGKTVMLAVDHGYFLGPTTGLKNLNKAVMPLAPYADCLMLTRGALRTSIDPGVDNPIVLRVSGCNSILSEDLSNEEITVSMEDAVRLNASGVAYSIYVGSKFEKQGLKNLTKLIDQGEQYGIPVLAVTAVGKEMVRDARYLGLACRIAAELGASWVKTYYCEEGFDKMVENTPVPLVIAGGKKIPEKDALKLAHDAITAGAVGVDMGRNIFQSENPIAMIKSVRAVVHEKATVKEAYQLYEELSKKKK